MGSSDTFAYKMEKIGREMHEAATEMGKRMDVMMADFQEKVAEAERQLKK